MIELQQIKPMIEFRRDRIKKILKDSTFEFGNGEFDPQKIKQENREKTILCKVYYKEENIPENPNMEDAVRCSLASIKNVPKYSLKDLFETEIKK